MSLISLLAGAFSMQVSRSVTAPAMASYCAVWAKGMSVSPLFSIASITYRTVSMLMLRAGRNPLPPLPVALRTGNDIAVHKRKEDFVHKPDWYLQVLRDPARAGRSFAFHEIRDYIPGDMQGKHRFEPLACLERIGLEFVGVHVLVGKRQLRPRTGG